MNEEEAIQFVRDLYTANSKLRDTDCSEHCFLYGVEVGYQYPNIDKGLGAHVCEHQKRGYRIGKEMAGRSRFEELVERFKF